MSDSDQNQIRVNAQRIVDMFAKMQWQKPSYEGTLSVRVFTGATAQQGLATYGAIAAGADTPVSQEQNHDYLTDINVWSRGSVSSAGVVTPNTTAINVGADGGPYITVAPGETITLRRKNPRKLFFNAAKAPASTDTVVFFW